MHHLSISRCKFWRRHNAREETLSYFTVDEKKRTFTTSVCRFVKETDIAIFRSGHRAEKTRRKTDRLVLFARKQSRYLYPATPWGVGRFSACLARIRKFAYSWNTEVPVAHVGVLLFLCVFFYVKSSFPVIRASVNVGRQFLQIAASRYRIGNFRNLSRPSDDLLPAHRPFDTANALDRSMHSTSLRSIDTSDTLHRDM